MKGRSRRKLIHDAARKLGARIDNSFDEAILDSAIDERPAADAGDPSNSDVMNTALTAVEDAKQALASTKETCEEVRRAEDDK